VIDQITRTTEQHDRARQEREQLEHEQRVASAEVAQRRSEREVALVALERERRAHPLKGWQPSKELQEQVRNAADRAGVAPVGEEAVALQDALAEAEDTLRSAGPIHAPRGG
jgi:hypothetical protein